MSTSTETATTRSKSNVNFMRLFERYALILVWLLLTMQGHLAPLCEASVPSGRNETTPIV